jgi:hypothetical protein
MIQTEIKYKAMIHYKHFPGSLRDICKIYSVSKIAVKMGTSSSQMPTHANGSRTTKYTELVSWCIQSENLHDMHRYQKRMHQDTWYMSITHHSLPSTVQSKYHTQTCSAHKRRQRYKTIHCITIMIHTTTPS